MASPFHSTSWSLISRTRESGDAARQATAALCRLYWQPLYIYARHVGKSEHEAEDAIQDFLLHVVEHDVFAKADSDRGRFRTFLLSALRQFLAHRSRDEQRLKRAPASPVLSLNVEHAEQALKRSGGGSPEQEFDRAWAMAQLDLTWQQVEAEFAESGKSDLVRRLRPVIAGQSDTTVRELAAELGMSEGAVNVAAHRLRRRFGETLREQIALTLTSADELDDEIARLRVALSGSPS